MKRNIKNAWDLFHGMFSIGDEVIIITDKDVYEWGKMVRVDDKGITLKRKDKKEKEWEWEEVSFMSHDGFPIRKLPPTSSDLYVEKLLEDVKSRTLQNCIRRALSFGECLDCEKITENNHVVYANRCPECNERFYKQRRSFTGGHPWQIEGVTSQIFNMGNYSYPHWSNHAFEEVIVMKDKNGLGGQLWDLPSIFEFGGV
jgi:DNA-directed RNA polymerase subunit RPC12/RpoP